jgi:hypothetical protein
VDLFRGLVICLGLVNYIEDATALVFSDDEGVEKVAVCSSRWRDDGTGARGTLRNVAADICYAERILCKRESNERCRKRRLGLQFDPMVRCGSKDTLF